MGRVVREGVVELCLAMGALLGLAWALDTSSSPASAEDVFTAVAIPMVAKVALCAMLGLFLAGVLIRIPAAFRRRG